MPGALLFNARSPVYKHLPARISLSFGKNFMEIIRCNGDAVRMRVSFGPVLVKKVWLSGGTVLPTGHARFFRERKLQRPISRKVTARFQ